MESAATSCEGFDLAHGWPDVPDRVELHTFPEIVIDRIPKLRGHRFVVSDGDVVIVGARSREIQLVVRR